MAHSLTRWLRREPVAAGRHVRVMPSTTVPGAAPALVASATQVVIAAESEQAARDLDRPEPVVVPAEQVAIETAPPIPEPAVEAPVAEQPAAPAPSEPDPQPAHHAAEPVLAPVEQQAPVPAPAPAVAVEPPPFEPPPWDLPAPAAPPAPAADPVPSSSPFGGRYEPHPVALEFSDGARFELDEDDPRFESFLAAAAAVTGAAHDSV
jgi:hypothetical protein